MATWIHFLILRTIPYPNGKVDRRLRNRIKEPFKPVVIIVFIIFFNSFLVYCLLQKHTFQANPNSVSLTIYFISFLYILLQKLYNSNIAFFLIIISRCCAIRHDRTDVYYASTLRTGCVLQKRMSKKSRHSAVSNGGIL